MRRYYNKNVKDRSFVVGDLVLKWKTNQEGMHKLSMPCEVLGILNVITKNRLSSLILITAPKMPNLSLMPLKPSCHPQHDMRDAVLKYAIALLYN